MRHGHQKMAGYGLQEGNCAVQTLDQRFIGDLGDTLLACPGCNLLQRIAAGAPGQHQPQKVGAGPHAARATPGPGRAGAAPERPDSGRSSLGMLAASQLRIVPLRAGSSTNLSAYGGPPPSPVKFRVVSS